jgi:hypothetical protein
MLERRPQNSGREKLDAVADFVTHGARCRRTYKRSAPKSIKFSIFQNLVSL